PRVRRDALDARGDPERDLEFEASAVPSGCLAATPPRPRRTRAVRAAPAGRNRPRPRRVRLVLRERGRVYGDREASPPPIVRRRRTEAPPIHVRPIPATGRLRPPL